MQPVDVVFRSSKENRQNEDDEGLHGRQKPTFGGSPKARKTRKTQRSHENMDIKSGYLFNKQELGIEYPPIRSNQRIA